MISSENELRIDMEIRSDQLAEGDLPDAEMHIVYRRVKYDALLELEDKFIGRPLSDLIRDAKEAVEAVKAAQ